MTEEPTLKCSICNMTGTKARNMRRRCANSYEVKNLMVEGGHCRIEEIGAEPRAKQVATADRMILTDEMEILIGGPHGLEYALAFMVSGMETLNRFSMMPAQKKMTADYAAMGREAMRRHGSGRMEMLDEAIRNRKDKDA